MIFSEGNKHKPAIKFDKNTGVLSITGSSFPENAIVVYDPVIKWIEKFNFNEVETFTVKISLEYYNTATSKKLFEIIKNLNQTYQNGKKIEIIWEYLGDDEDMFESGRYYSELVEIPFRFIEIQD
ncbi:MAG: hypothetical protein C0599_02935 [Salinivirgaceae bacterium]|nr:MAG: hypothetical protein C0599_02935 [Salinivirgaceae bacterium]